MHPMTSEVIHNRYELKQRLGSGAMGSVYRAYDRLTGDEVALKQVINSHETTTVDQTTANLALAHEFQVLASLRHPNIIGVLDYGFYGQKNAYFTMSFVRDSRNMRMATSKHRITEKVLLLVQLLNALVYLERRDIMHRDLKPDNILVTPDDQVKVVDFGLARNQQQMTDTEIGGTLAYIAPEVFQGELPTHLSDLYAVGVIAYEILSQQPLYASDIGLMELMHHAVSTPPDFKPFLERVAASLEDDDAFNVAANSADGSTQVLNSKTIPSQPDDNATRKFQDETVQSPPPDEKTQVAAYQLPTYISVPFNAIPTDLASLDLIEGEEPVFRLARVVQKLLAKNPRQRYQRAEEAIYDLCRAINVPPIPQTSAIRESFLQAARFIGRDAEFNSLSEGLEHALKGQGGLYFIGGESGAGKSRLLSELRHLALVKGMLVLSGQSVREGSLLYQAWREPIRRLTLYGPMTETNARSLKPIIPDLDRLLGRVVPEDDEEDNAVQRITSAILDLFRECPDPILLLLEDWQWAHAESRETLKRLYEYAQTAHIFIVVSYRNDEAPTLPEQYPGSKTIQLDRLGASAVEELARSILGQRQFRPEFIETLHRHTEGNVFFLIEAIRALSEEAGSLEDVVNATLSASLVTGGMTQVVQRRLDKMTTRYRPLLEVAAVIGRELNLRLLRELNKGKRIDFEDWLTNASNAAIVEYRDEVWRFSHDKLRQQILVRLDSARLKQLHRQVAEAIERLYPAEEQAAVLVTHWREAGNAERELHYIRIAGEQATRYNAYDDARRLYERALMLTEEPLLVMEFNNLLGGVCEYLSQYDRATQCLDIVMVLARQLNQPTALAEALHKMAWTSMRQGDMGQAHQHAAEALTIARQANQSLLTVRALSALGVIYVIQGNSAESRAHLEQALPLVKTLNNDYLHATILNTLGAAYEGEGRIEDAIKVLMQAAEMAEAIRNRDLLANVHGNLGRILYIQKRSVQAEDSFLKALPSFQEVGNLYGAALANDYLGLIAAQRYDTKAAKPYLREGIRISRLIGAQTVTLLALCGIAHLHIYEDRESRAAELVGLILGHPASAGDADVKRESDIVLGRITLAEDARQAALDRGRALDFDDAVYQEQDGLETPAS